MPIVGKNTFHNHVINNPLYNENYQIFTHRCCFFLLPCHWFLVRTMILMPTSPAVIPFLPLPLMALQPAPLVATSISTAISRGDIDISYVVGNTQYSLGAISILPQMKCPHPQSGCQRWRKVDQGRRWKNKQSFAFDVTQAGDVKEWYWYLQNNLIWIRVIGRYTAKTPMVHCWWPSVPSWQWTGWSGSHQDGFFHARTRKKKSNPILNLKAPWSALLAISMPTNKSAFHRQRPQPLLVLWKPTRKSEKSQDGINAEQKEMLDII